MIFDILRKVRGEFYQAKPKEISDERAVHFLNILDKGLGHKKSFDTQKPISAGGEPFPWFTYPAIEYLKQLDFRDLIILEWGIGNSTKFFASRCKEIYTIEHNENWFTLIKEELPSNAKPILVTEEDYVLMAVKTNQKFDLIIIDGIKRDECIKAAKQLLKQSGIIIFDNSDRNPELCEILRNQHFLQVDFHGFGPINLYSWTTTIFFSRESNIQPISIQPLIPAGGGY